MTINAQARLYSKFFYHSPNEILKRLKTLFQFSNFKISGETQVIITDEYFDTDEKSLLKSNSSLRVRKNNNGYFLIIKESKKRKVGTITRNVIENKLSEKEYDNLKHEKFNSIINKNFIEIIGFDIIHIVTIINNRNIFFIKKDDEEYKIMVDYFHIEEPLNKIVSKSQMEIEIQASDGTSLKKLDTIKIKIPEIYPEFILKNETKYESSIKFIENLPKTRKKKDSPLKILIYTTSLIIIMLIIIINLKVFTNISISKIITGISVLTLGLSILYYIPKLFFCNWINYHPNKLGLYIASVIFIIAVSTAIIFDKMREKALWTVAFGVLSVILQLIGGFNNIGFEDKMKKN